MKEVDMQNTFEIQENKEHLASSEPSITFSLVMDKEVLTQLVLFIC